MVFTARYRQSPSLRGRGLKYGTFTYRLKYPLVALFARAWIEIIVPTRNILLFVGRPLCEGVDWNTLCVAALIAWYVALFARAWIEIHLFNDITSIFFGRPLCEGVDWNVLQDLFIVVKRCRPLCEGVDWNHAWRIYAISPFGRPLCEGVDWNKRLPLWVFYDWVALFARAWIEIKFFYRVSSHCKWSPSLRGRGLK